MHTSPLGTELRTRIIVSTQLGGHARYPLWRAYTGVMLDLIYDQLPLKDAVPFVK